jgi:polyhydroxyalkanoate synthesis regulator phasin
MPQRGEPRDLLSRLADAGEEAIKRLGDAPGANRVAEVVTTLRDRVDELQKKVRGLDELEQRVDALEKRLAAVEKKPAPRRRAAPTAKKTS